MSEETKSTKNEKKSCKPSCNPCGGSSAIYGLGVIGAAIYFVQQADGFVPILLGIIKAVFWPSLLMYELLKYLQL